MLWPIKPFRVSITGQSILKAANKISKTQFNDACEASQFLETAENILLFPRPDIHTNSWYLDIWIACFDDHRQHCMFMLKYSEIMDTIDAD